MEYTSKQKEYIDSVDGEAHQSAVKIIGNLQAELESIKLYAGGLENAQGFLDDKIAHLQTQLQDKQAEIDKLEKTISMFERGITTFPKGYETAD